MEDVRSGRLILFIAYCSLAGAGASHALEVHGHRGARARLPENTLPAFEYALRLGVDVLELDTHLSADGVPMVTHDARISAEHCQTREGQPPGRKARIRKLTRAEIQAFDCGSKPDPAYPDQRAIPGATIPTLDEVLALGATNSVRFNIELKTPSEALADAVVRRIAQRGWQNRVLIQSFWPQALRRARRIDPATLTSHLTVRSLERFSARFSARNQVISPDYRSLSERDVAWLRRRGFKVVPYSPNDAGSWKKLIEWNVDGIITDDPEPLLRLLGRVSGS